MSQSGHHKRHNKSKLKKPTFSKQEIRKKIQMLQDKVNSAYLTGDVETSISIMNDIFLLRQQLDENSEG